MNWKIVFVLLLLAVAVFFAYNYLQGEKQREAEEIGSCELSLCDCKCYLKGKTPEAMEGKACEKNCVKEFGIAGCELKGSECVAVEAIAGFGEGAGIANPASENCVNLGHQLEIRSDESGGQYGVCVFPDGTECEEWAFFRGECRFEGAN